MPTATTLDKGRQAFSEHAWRDAYELLSSLANEGTLDPDDLEQLAKAAYLIGKELESTELLSRAHHKFLNRENIPKAAYCAFWVGMILFNLGEEAQASGWMARAQRLIDDFPKKCAEQGFLLIPKALQRLRDGDAVSAYDLFNQANEIGNHFNNHDVTALGRLGRGQALIMQGKIVEGTRLFDETMVSVVSDDISPIVAGIVYCAVIESCQKIYDLSRAREWTKALTRWCDSQPDLVPYRGQCMIHRAEIMQLHGDWEDAVREIQRACQILSKPPADNAAGEAFYRQGELYRLKGKFSKAIEMYRQASKNGKKPQPGLALLRLDQDQLDVAKTAICQVEKEKKGPTARSAILPAYIDIMLAADDLPSAKNAAEELSKIANEFSASFLQAAVARAQGKLLFEADQYPEALEKFRRAWSFFNETGASYEAAQTRVLIGLTGRKVGDEDTAKLELDAARWIFKKLGAAPDLQKVDNILRNYRQNKPHGLTPRELQVLRLLATGKTNKEIASELFISERTVDRHVSNIYGKLNVPSRSAATAYAYEHRLI